MIEDGQLAFKRSSTEHEALMPRGSVTTTCMIDGAMQMQDALASASKGRKSGTACEWVARMHQMRMSLLPCGSVSAAL